MAGWTPQLRGSHQLYLGSNPSNRVEMLRCWQRVTKMDVPWCPCLLPGLHVDEFDFWAPDLSSVRYWVEMKCDVYSALKTRLKEHSFLEYILNQGTGPGGRWSEGIHSFPHSLNKSFKNTMPGWAPKVWQGAGLTWARFWTCTYRMSNSGWIWRELGFPSGSEGKEPACGSGDSRDPGLIPGLGRSPGEGMATHSSILAWRSPWIEEHGGLQSRNAKRKTIQLSRLS